MSAPRCEKCGSDDVLTRWHGPGSYHSSRGPISECYGDYGQTRGKPKAEHLHYHCRTCQYDWVGPVLAAPATTLNEPEGET